MKIFGFLTVLGAVYGQGYGNGGADNKVSFYCGEKLKIILVALQSVKT